MCTEIQKTKSDLAQIIWSDDVIVNSEIVALLQSCSQEELKELRIWLSNLRYSGESMIKNHFTIGRGTKIVQRCDLIAKLFQN